jgi:PLP dependent protein
VSDWAAAPPAGDARARELATNVRIARERIAAACAAAGRSPDEVTLVAITKTWPAADVRRLAALGIADVGESRDQEARDKVAECSDLALRWHFVGQLQRNKANSVARYADVVESVDRPSLVGPLDRGAQRAGRRIGVCLQVDLDGGGAGRGGARPADLPALADAVARAEQLQLLGVMAVAPLGAAPGPAFARLADVHDSLLAEHPEAAMRSAGMSGDFAEAISAGATHVRLGSALLGRRDPLK